MIVLPNGLTLRANDFPLDEYIETGAFSIKSTRDAYLLDGYFDTKKMCDFWSDAIKDANEAGYPAVRAAAEMTWALSMEPGCDQLVAYESQLNNVFPQSKVSALCQYNRKRFNAQIVKDIIHVHPIVVVDGDVIDNPGFRRPAEFIESHTEMDVRALLDGLTMSKRLSQANAQLREALAAKEKAQALIEQRNRECEHLYQELMSLAKVVSHEMQAPLSVMQSYLRLISVRYKNQLGADADEFIDKSVQAAQLVARMIDDLWTYARVDHGDHESEFLEVVEVIGDALKDLQVQISQSNARVETIAINRLPRIQASRNHIRYLFSALISNACTYSRLGCQPEIRVGCKENENEWIFFVRDNGRGIDEIYSLDVFKLFNRLHEKPRASGTGMGLAISKRIVDHYRGRIWFEPNSDGPGTTFWFSLPRNSNARYNVTEMRDYLAKTRAEARNFEL